MAAWAMCRKREQEALSGRPLCCVASPGRELRGEGTRLRCMATTCRFELLPRELRSVATGAHVGHAPQGWRRRGARGWGRIGKGGDGGGGRGV